jgi:uncharacterized protein (TIGR02594 family)
VIRQAQKALAALGYVGADGKPPAPDGIMGPNTRRAVINYQSDLGLPTTGQIDAATAARLGIAAPVAPPWYVALEAKLGMHERRDNKRLRAWLASDGGTVGDPADVPWCGDAVATALREALPKEIMPFNPYAAIGWNMWGQYVKPQLGSVLVFWRGSPEGWQGHVGFYAGESAANYYVLGGNQSNSVSIAPISKNRLRKGGSRWPLTGQAATGITVARGGGVVSVNEA